MATHPVNPHPVHSYEWWMAEGRISDEDGHHAAAMAAYNQAAEAARDAFCRELAEDLRDSVPEGSRD